MPEKVLIAFATKFGATQDTAQQIAEILRSKYALEVDIVDLRQIANPDFSHYGSIIVASGIRMGKWYKEALQFLDSDFEGKKVAIFVSAMYNGENTKTYQLAIEGYLKDVSNKHLNVTPVTMEVFGGRMKFAGRITADNRDKNRINAWAQSLVDKIGRQDQVLQPKVEQ